MSVMGAVSAMQQMQQHVLALQTQNGRQSAYIQQLLRTIKELRTHNGVLQDLLLESVGSSLDLNDLPEIVDDVLNGMNSNEAPNPYSRSVSSSPQTQGSPEFGSNANPMS